MRRHFVEAQRSFDGKRKKENLGRVQTTQKEVGIRLRRTQVTRRAGEIGEQQTVVFHV